MFNFQSTIAKEGVVLLHGLARTSKSMSKLESTLLAEGYEVVNIDYPSRKATIEELTDFVRAHVIGKTADWDCIHFVTHSMGGIIVRQIQQADPLPRLGRVVMIAPPNQGSEIVDRLAGMPAFRLLNGPAGLQLGTAADGFVASLGPVDFELGVIAGDRSANPFLSLMISGRNDGKVSVESAKVEGMRAFRLIHASHPFIMRKRDVIAETIRFLQNGDFLNGQRIVHDDL